MLGPISDQARADVCAAAIARPAAQLRCDYRKIAAIYGDNRAPERIVAHYDLERRLAARMRLSTQSQREHGLYTEMYDALLGELDDHPRKRPITEKGRRNRAAYVRRQADLILGHMRERDVFLEIGGGDCEVTLLLARHVEKAIVIDVTDELAPPDAAVANFQFIKTAGVNLPLASDSVSFVYSNQVMEHLHPDDARAQMREIFRVLKPGGQYLCRTPSRVTGPHDVSRYFDAVAVGTHMKEYIYAELIALFDEAGFTRQHILVAPRAYRVCTLPRFIALAAETLFARVPRNLHTLICRSHAVRALLGVTMIGEKWGLGTRD